MTPYYTDEHVTLWHGNCLDVSDWLGADILVTDPPYGIDGNLSFGHRGRKPAAGHQRVNAKPKWDSNLTIRNDALALWGDKPYAVFGSPTRLDDIPQFREFPLVWDKGIVGMGDTTFPWGRGYELVYVNGPGWTGRRESPVIRVAHLSSAATQIGHPTPKPVALMEAILAKAPPGVIADPFAGAGATLVAAKALGRRAIGVELEERYCEIAANRLAQGVLDLTGGAA